MHSELMEIPMAVAGLGRAVAAGPAAEDVGAHWEGPQAAGGRQERRHPLRRRLQVWPLHCFPFLCLRSPAAVLPGLYSSEHVLRKLRTAQTLGSSIICLAVLAAQTFISLIHGFVMVDTRCDTAAACQAIIMYWGVVRGTCRRSMVTISCVPPALQRAEGRPG